MDEESGTFWIGDATLPSPEFQGAERRIRVGAKSPAARRLGVPLEGFGTEGGGLRSLENRASTKGTIGREGQRTALTGYTCFATRIEYRMKGKKAASRCELRLCEYARRDLNPQPSVPKTDALSN
jgi:hypothetical protein